MIHIVVSLGHRVLAEHRFDQDRVRIGRTPDNDLQLDNPVLSRHHAEVARCGTGWRLSDLGSRNGVYVNGRRELRHELNPGDCIGIGKFALTVRFEPGPVGARGETGWPEPRDLEDYVAQGRTLNLPVPTPDKRRSEAVPVSAHLAIRRGPPFGTYLLRKDAFHIGTTGRSELRLPGVVPEEVAVIVRGLSGYSLVNVSRRARPVFHNGKPMALRAPLRDDDRIEVGKVLITFKQGQPC